jgi:hypothetical protein
LYQAAFVMISTYTFSSLTFEAFQAQLKHALNTIDFKPTLAFAFVSFSFPITRMMDIFKEEHIPLFGSSSGGEILFDREKNYVGEKSAVIVLTDISADSYQIHLVSKDMATSYVLGKQLGEKISRSYRQPGAIVMATGLSMDGQALVNGICKKVGRHLPLYGGLAGDDSRFLQTFVFTEEAITDQGAIVLVLNQSKIELTGMINSGWISLGAEFTVNRAEGNIVYEINGLPALDMYKDYLNVLETDLPAIGVEYPFLVNVDNGSTVLRAVTGINREDRSLIFAGTVPQGAKVSFSISPGFEIMENTRDKIIAFHRENKRADLLLLFSCIARLIALGPLVSTEIKLAAIKWKRPLAGFFTYGEIGNAENGDPAFHNQTFTLALLRKKRN